MPLFKVERRVTQELVIEAPDAQFAKDAVECLASYEWGYEDERVVFHGLMPATAAIDITIDLRGRQHPHAFEDEDTGGCIYCDEPAPAQVG